MANSKIIEKFSYFDVSKSNQTFSTKIQTCNKLFFNKFFYSSYLSDCKNYYEKLIEIPSNKRDIVRKSYQLYKIGDYALMSFIGYRLYYHIRKGYFRSNSRLLDIYILLKLSFYLITLYYLKFFIFKSKVDSFLFDYFSIKEYNVALLQEKRSFDRKSREIK